MKKCLAMLLVFALLAGSLVCYADEMEDGEFEVILEDREDHSENEPDIEIGEDGILFDETDEDISLDLSLSDIDTVDDILAGDDVPSPGEDSSGEVIPNQVVNGPVTQAVGNGFYWPLVEHLKENNDSGFMPMRWRSKTVHLAVDYYSPDKDNTRGIGKTVYPIFSGTVMSISSNADSGKYVKIKHEFNGLEFYSQYQHLYSVSDNLKENDPVVGGTTELGIEGKTGNAQGVHLHLIVWSKDPSNPWPNNAYDLQNYNQEDPDTHEPIQFSTTIDGKNKFAPVDGIINDKGEYIKHPYLFVKWTDSWGANHEAKFYNPEQILNGSYTPGDERKKVTTITLNKKTATLYKNKNETIQLTAEVAPDDAAYKEIEWRSSNPAVATVSESGLVTPVSIGETDIVCTAKDGGGARATCHIKVVSFEIEPKSIDDAYIGYSTTIVGKVGNKKVKCTYTTSDKRIVSVTSKGKITANREGNATITVKSPDGQKEKCEITVHPLPTSLYITQGSAVDVNVGESIDLKYEFKPKDALSPNKVVWSTDEKKGKGVISLDASTGQITGLKEGTAVVWASLKGINKKPKITVVVKDPNRPTGMSLFSDGSEIKKGETITLSKGGKLKISVKLKPDSAITKLTWKVDKTKYVTVKSTGDYTAEIKGIKEGTSKITVSTSVNGVSMTFQVKVDDPFKPTSVTIKEKSPLKMYMGDTMQLHASVIPSTVSQKITWKSYNSSCVAVTQDGTITAKGKGKARIRATSKANNKVYREIIVSVSKPTSPDKSIDMFEYLYRDGVEAAKELGLNNKKEYQYEVVYYKDGVSIIVWKNQDTGKLEEVFKIDLKNAPQNYNICGVYCGMTLSNAEKVLKAAGWSTYPNYDEDGRMNFVRQRAGIKDEYLNWLVVDYKDGKVVEVYLDDVLGE